MQRKSNIFVYLLFTIHTRMKDEIYKALKTKFQNLGFKDATFDGVAAYLAITVTEASQIETAIGGVESLLKSFQGDADTRVQTAVEKAKADAKANPDKSKEEKPEGDKTPKAKTKEEGGDQPDLAKLIADAVIAAQAPILAKLEGYEKKTEADNQKTQLETALKDAPEVFKKSALKAFARMKFETGDAFTEYLTDVSADAAEAAQQHKNTELSAGGRPFVPTGPADDKKATKEELDGVSNLIKF